MAAVVRLRKRGMKIGGRHRFVIIDESKFAHKRKVSYNSLCRSNLTFYITRYTFCENKFKYSRFPNAYFYPSGVVHGFDDKKNIFGFAPLCS